MNWSSYESITYRNKRYGQKDAEFMKLINLPQKVFPTVLEVALYKPRVRSPRNFAVSVPLDILETSGWKIVDASEVCPDFSTYRRYIHQSKGEWSVAKNGYVVGRSGWFSGRSACYLAAGRPVVVQDTGFSKVLPVGEGVISFSTVDEAEAGIREVEANYQRHAKAAQDIAETYFDSDKIINRILDITLNTSGSDDRFAATAMRFAKRGGLARPTSRSRRVGMSRDLRIVIMGILGRTPLAGVSWQVLHYLEGFRRLGYDIYYIEDTGGWAYNPRRKTDDNESNIPMLSTASTPSIMWPNSCHRSACRMVGLTGREWTAGFLGSPRHRCRACSKRPMH